MPTRAPDRPTGINDVHLVGRLAGQVVRRELPSGDVLASFRLVVPRPAARSSRRDTGGGSSRSPTVDTIDCISFRRDVQRRLERMPEGEQVEVQGALRRRFWRSGNGTASRSEVEVVRLRRAPDPG